MEWEEGLKVLYEVDSRAGLGGWFERAMAGEGGPALHNGEVQVEMGMEEKDMAQYNRRVLDYGGRRNSNFKAGGF